MFYGCYSLKNINIYNFNIDNECELKRMFFGCKEELKKTIRSKYNTIREEAFE